VTLRELSGVARPLDFGYPSNLWIATVAAATFAVVLLWQGLADSGGTDPGWAGAAAAGARAGLAVFLAWAICRELDPDRAGAALVAALLAIGGLAALELPNITACVVVLLAVRVLTRTSGVPATLPDAALLIGLGVWVGLDDGWVYPGAAAAALLADGLLPAHGRRRLTVTLAGAVAAFATLYLIRQTGGAALVANPDVAASTVAVLAALLLLPTALAVSHVQAVADATGEPLLPLRVRAGQALALAVGLIATSGHGFDGLAELMPLWAAVIAVGVFRWLPGSGTHSTGPARRKSTDGRPLA
jgi:hypothetical protein